MITLVEVRKLETIPVKNHEDIVNPRCKIRLESISSEIAYTSDGKEFFTPEGKYSFSIDEFTDITNPIYNDEFRYIPKKLVINFCDYSQHEVLVITDFLKDEEFTCLEDIHKLIIEKSSGHTSGVKNLSEYRTEL